MTHLSSPPAAQEVAAKVERHGPVLLMGRNRRAKRNASAGEAQ
jgi:hypothetical protein